MRKQNEFTRILQTGMLVILPLALASCTRDEREEMETPEETSAPAPAENTVAEPVTVDISSVDSQVEGEATISRVGESLMVSLTLEKLAGEGPFRAQILSGRCENRKDAVPNRTDQPAGRGATRDTNAPATPRAGTTPESQAQGQVLATLEPIQLSGGAGQPTAEQSGMSHSTIPVADLRSMKDVFIEVQGQGARTIGCGNVGNMDRLMTGTTSTTPVTPAPATPPATPGARP